MNTSEKCYELLEKLRLELLSKFNLKPENHNLRKTLMGKSRVMSKECAFDWNIKFAEEKHNGDCVWLTITGPTVDCDYNTETNVMMHVRVSGSGIIMGKSYKDPVIEGSINTHLYLITQLYENKIQEFLKTWKTSHVV